MILYHGTTIKNLKRILREGIKPRKSKKSNWEGYGTSRSDLVYLSDCYAPFYAWSACKKTKDKGVIIKLEIDPKKITLYPDEEFLFNVLGFKEKAKQEGNKEKIYQSINPTKYQFLEVNGEAKEGWRASLNYMGVVTAKFIPKECIVSYYVEKKKLEFILNCDPSISPLNYQICGQRYRDYLEKLEYTKVARRKTGETKITN